MSKATNAILEYPGDRRVVATGVKRLAVCGDWHANVGWMEFALNHIATQNIELVVHVGDLGFFPNWDNVPDGFLTPMNDLLAENGLQMVFIDGNHDDHSVLKTQSQDYEKLGSPLPSWNRITYMPRGSLLEFPEASRDWRRWLMVGGAASIDRDMRTPGLDWWLDEALTDTDVERASAWEGINVLVAHDCPALKHDPFATLGKPEWASFEVMRSLAANRQKLGRIMTATHPRLVIHGHYHKYYYQMPEVPDEPTLLGLDCDGAKDPADNIEIIDIVDEPDDAKVPEDWG